VKKWDYDKPIEEMSRAEIELQGTFDYIKSLELKLQKLEAVVDGLYFKASISHSLLVVEKTSEETMRLLNLMNGKRNEG